MNCVFEYKNIPGKWFSIKKRHINYNRKHQKAELNGSDPKGQKVVVKCKVR